jgi:hypothetical protein
MDPFTYSGRSREMLVADLGRSKIRPNLEEDDARLECAQIERKISGARFTAVAEVIRQMIFRVFVDDNFHYMEEEERRELGSFPTADAALEASRRIVDEYLVSAYRPGMTAEQLFSSYQAFGEDPFIKSEDGKAITCSAWESAKQRCNEMCIQGLSHGRAT